MPPTPGPARQDTFRVTVQVKNPNTGRLENMGVFDKKSGGGLDTDVYKYKAGGMVPEISLGGSPTYGDVTLQRLYRYERDHLRLNDWMAWCGHATTTILQFPMDIDGNAWDTPITMVGILKTVNPPDHDSESNNPAMLEIVVSPHGAPRVA
jgi:hypothetical protein